MTDLVWTTQKRKLSALKDFENNPRQITENMFENLKKSLRDFNYVELVAVDADNTILAGHMRVRAIRKIHGNKGDIEVRVPNRPLTKEEKEKYVLISNHTVGTFDIDILANSWSDDLLFDVGFTPGDLGYDEKGEAKVSKPKKKRECPECGHEF